MCHYAMLCYAMLCYVMRAGGELPRARVARRGRAAVRVLAALDCRARASGEHRLRPPHQLLPRRFLHVVKLPAPLSGHQGRQRPRLLWPALAVPTADRTGSTCAHVPRAAGDTRFSCRRDGYRDLLQMQLRNSLLDAGGAGACAQIGENASASAAASWRHLVIVNAWNEWGEQSVLEPTVQDGSSMLDAHRAALGAVEAFI